MIISIQINNQDASKCVNKWRSQTDRWPGSQAGKLIKSRKHSDTVGLRGNSVRRFDWFSRNQENHPEVWQVSDDQLMTYVLAFEHEDKIKKTSREKKKARGRGRARKRRMRRRKRVWKRERGVDGMLNPSSLLWDTLSASSDLCLRRFYNPVSRREDESQMAEPVTLMASHFLDGLKFTEQIHHFKRKEVKGTNTLRTGSRAGTLIFSWNADYVSSEQPQWRRSRQGEQH